MIKLKELLSKSIKWIEPTLENEVGEYFENPVTKKNFKKHGYIFNTIDSLLSFLYRGRLVSIDKSELESNSENLTTSKSDFEQELLDSEYAKSYKNMENELSRGTIELEAPIIIKFGNTYYGFAGNRRMNLAWNYKIPLKVWLVKGK